MPEALRIMIETGQRRVFANALDWPGWSRSARTAEAAVATLAACADRYRPVATHAGLVLPEHLQPQVSARVAGTATTDFGAPDVLAPDEAEPADPDQAARLAALLEGAWLVWDAAVGSSPESLRKGPRGGGRDRTPMVRHVLGAQTSYARRLGLSGPEPDPTDLGAVEAQRAALLEVVRSGRPAANPRRTLWPVRYAVRRLAWHVLDHAWEMEDRRA